MALFSILTITDGLTFFIYTLFILQQPFNSLGHSLCCHPQQKT